MTGSCSVCLYIDSPFALLGMVHIRPFELQIFRYSVFMLSCSIKMWKHVAFLSIPNSCLNLTLFIHRPYVFPPVRICFLHPTLTMRKQPTSFPWCAPHFFLGWMIPWINKTLEGHRDLGQVELLDPKWLNTQFTRPVATHIFFCLKFSPWKKPWGFHDSQFDGRICFMVGLGFNHELENLSSQEIPPSTAAIETQVAVQAHDLGQCWVWPPIFCAGREGRPGMRMTHHDLQDLYRDLYRFYFWDQFCRNKVLKFVRNGWKWFIQKEYPHFKPPLDFTSVVVH